MKKISLLMLTLCMLAGNIAAASTEPTVLEPIAKQETEQANQVACPSYSVAKDVGITMFKLGTFIGILTYVGPRFVCPADGLVPTAMQAAAIGFATGVLVPLGHLLLESD